ncbi:MAG: hypothetical protein RML36_15600 [Anaerolineae bacterium]|nr:hypothetical protein [Anaerolineae bacterium]
MECVRLRIQDINLEYRTITVRDDKGEKNRIVPLHRPGTALPLRPFCPTTRPQASSRGSGPIECKNCWDTALVRLGDAGGKTGRC